MERSSSAAGSGGSIYLILKKLVLGEGSFITADGQNAEDGKSGPGSGGRVLMNNICWQDGTIKDRYSFTNKQFSVAAGKRELETKYLKLKKLIEAENGSKNKIFFKI